MARSHTAPAWRRAFLRELSRGGSVALAAEKVGIDRSSAYQARRANAAFAVSWERALADARARLAAGGAEGLRGDEVVRSSRAGRPCVLRAGPGRWCVRKEQVFLATLCGTANVAAAARAAGVSTAAVYNRRRLWPAFARAWDAAKDEGWVRIEMLLIEAATNTLDPALRQAQDERADGDAEGYAAPEMSVEQVLKLWFHRDGREGGRGGRGRGCGWRRQEPDIEAVRAAILRKIAAMERARERVPALSASSA